ncbi:hypothetical protein [Snodgrassella alvi]|uniref:hypothetical protein n=1 Tax=Snodgrassella alvi TaxID=1196083 RepID=UPI0015D52CE6|nr:hypothetical protein [Snodgrassella alvi]
MLNKGITWLYLISCQYLAFNATKKGLRQRKGKNNLSRFVGLLCDKCGHIFNRIDMNKIIRQLKELVIAEAIEQKVGIFGMCTL